MIYVKNNLHTLAAVLTLLIGPVTLLRAQIVTDGSLAAPVTLNGLNVEITESMGQRSGRNLFHSFDTFNILTGGSATFKGAADFQNVISRVTGDSETVIQGLLRSEIGQADFYFFNPNGLVILEDASVEVPASFHVGTASELRFSDGEKFVAETQNRGALSVADPVAFGFLGDEGSILIDSSKLNFFKPGASVTLAGVNLQTVGGIATPFELEVVEGEIRLLAIGEAGGGVGFTDSASGNADYRGTASIDNSVFKAEQLGGITIAGGTVTMSGRITTALGEDGASIDIISTDLKLNDGSTIQTVTRDAVVSGGNIEVNAESLDLSDGSKISADTLSSATAGNVNVEVSGKIKIVGRSNGAGTTGIESDAGVPRTGISTTGNAGDIRIESASLEILQGGHIRSQAFSIGGSGNIKIEVDTIELSGDLPELGISATGVFSSSQGAGAAGKTEIVATNLSVKDTAIVGASETSGVGAAGEVVIMVKRNLVLDGVDSESLFKTGIVSDSTNSNQNGGVVDVTAGSITVKNGAQISAISASNDQPGRVRVVADNVSISRGGTVSSRATGAGKGGEIDLQVGNTLSVLGDISSSTATSAITTTADSDNAGRITVDARLTSLTNASITTSTQSTASDGGNITISGETLLLNSGLIQANAMGGSGGKIAIETAALVSANAQLSLNPQRRDAFVIGGPSVIQAVAPTGVSVEPVISPPDIDVSAALTEFDSGLANSAEIAASPCSSFVEGSPSTLTQLGRGGLAASVQLTEADFVRGLSYGGGLQVWFSVEPLLSVEVEFDATDAPCSQRSD